MLGPRVNAGGRIGAADLGARLLATDDPHEAAALAARLHALNAERREIEAGVLAAAEAQAEARGDAARWSGRPGEGWHPGVVGIVAARLKEASGRPAVVIGFDGDEGKGSGRSVAGVDLGAAVARLAARGADRRAAAATAWRRASASTRDQLEPAMARLAELLAAQGAGARRRARPAARRARRRRAPRRRSWPTSIAAAGPFGAGAPAPRLALPAARVSPAAPRSATAIWRWRSPTGWAGISTPSPFAPPPARSAPSSPARRAAVHLAGRLERDDWNGRRRVKLHLEDAAPEGQDARFLPER